MTNQLASVPEWIRGELEGRIIRGELKPGDRIGLKSDLREEFDVAGPTLDQALKLLVNDGLISLRRGPNGGVFVTRSEPVLRLGTKQLWARNPKSLGENIELREALTSLLGVSAARSMDRDESKLKELLAVAEKLRKADISFEAQQLIWTGHRLMVELADNDALRLIYLNLLDAAETLIIKVDFPSQGAEASREKRRIDAHAQLFQSVVDGDVELAHEFGELVRVVSPLGRDGHFVTVGSGQMGRFWSVPDLDDEEE